MEIFSFFKARGDLVPLFDDMAREGGMDSADVDWLYRNCILYGTITIMTSFSLNNII